MFHGAGRSGRSEQRHYDQVPGGSPPRTSSSSLLPPQTSSSSSSSSLLPPLHPLSGRRAPRLAQSADPPPPLPDRPPVGPDFHPGGSEGQLDSESDPDQDQDLDRDQDQDPALDIKPVHRFVPDSWKKFFRGGGGGSAWSMPASSSNNNSSSSSIITPGPTSPGAATPGATTSGVRCSPPHSPAAPASYRDVYGGSSSYDSRKELLGGRGGRESPSGRTYRTALSYGERVEEYHRRYAFMKSWAGLLRILGCVELLLGAAVFACVCAYIHKDNEWFNMFGYSAPGGAYGGAGGFYGAGAGGSYYTGPKTAFVLVVAALAWLVTVILLVLGMTMYYHTILLDAPWWPLTEFIINLALAVLYMAAGVVYVRDTTRGGLCSYPVFNNGINGAFCRTEAGQTAAIIFLFVTMAIYLVGAFVCLKLWRHEAARRYRERYGQEMQPSELVPVPTMAAAPPAAPPAAKAPQQERGSSVVPIRSAPHAAAAKVLRGAIPSGHIPKPVVVPDYIAKYPSLQSEEEQDQYRAVFTDQYSEYQELHADVQATRRRFGELDLLMQRLPQNPSTQMEVDRINRILQDYQRKKNDPTFQEKQERCEYLKNKLSHIKQKIQEYDQVLDRNHDQVLDRNHGPVLDRNHGPVLDRNHGPVLDRNHGPVLDRNHGPVLDRNHGYS